ncbi:MAG: membrane protein insertase YidC, partial [Acidobacteriota bacterium]
MEKRLVLAVIVSIVFFFLWSWLFNPAVPPKLPEEAIDDAGAPAIERLPDGATGPQPTAADRDRFGEERPRLTDAARGIPSIPGIPVAAAGAADPDIPTGVEISAEGEEIITIDTDLYAIRLSNRGAQVTSWKLLDYQDDDGEPLDLVSSAAADLNIRPLQILVDDPDATTRLRDALYRVERKEHQIEGRRILDVLFTYADGQGLAATKTLRIDAAGYLGEFGAAVRVAGRPVSPYVLWGAGFAAHTGLEKGYYADGSWAVAKINGDVEFQGQAQIEPGEPWGITGNISWAGMSDKYFAAVLIPDTPVPGRTHAEMHRLVRDGREQFYLSMLLLIPGVNRYSVFVGPKDYDILQAQNRDLDGLLDFGWFWFIAEPMFKALKFLYGYLGNYGWAIILLTIAIRMLLFAFMHKTQVNMKRMQDKMKNLQPKVKSLRERFKKLERKAVEKRDTGGRQKVRQQMNEEMMALYRREGVNPMGQMGGCLMLLLQMPIFLGFLKVLTIAI